MAEDMRKKGRKCLRYEHEWVRKKKPKRTEEVPTLRTVVRAKRVFLRGFFKGMCDQQLTSPTTINTCGLSLNDTISRSIIARGRSIFHFHGQNGGLKKERDTLMHAFV